MGLAGPGNMDALGHVYRAALERRYELPSGHAANWPPGTDLVLGQVGYMTVGGEFEVDGVLADKGIEARPASGPGRKDGPANFVSDESISLNFATSAKTPGFKWLGDAEAGVKVAFAESAGVALGIGSAHDERLEDLDSLRKKLVAAAEKGKFKEYQAVIVEMRVADSGCMVTSADGGGKLSASTKFEVSASTPVTLASFSADIAVKDQHGSIANEQYPEGFVVSYRVIMLGKRGLFWWRHWRTFGITELTLEQLELTLGKDDYLDTFPGAEFPEQTTIDLN